MKKKIFTVLLLLCGLSAVAEAQEAEKSFTVEVSNSWNKAKADEPIVIRLSEINPQFRVRSAVVMNGNEEIPSQLDDLDGDRRPDELAFVIDLPAKSKKSLTQFGKPYMGCLSMHRQALWPITRKSKQPSL